MRKITKEQFIYFLLGIIIVFLYNSINDLIIKIFLIIGKS